MPGHIYARQLIGSHYGIALFSVACCLDFSKHQKHMMLKAGNAHLNSEEGSFSAVDLLVLTDYESAVSRQADNFFSFSKQPTPNW